MTYKYYHYLLLSLFILTIFSECASTKQSSENNSEKEEVWEDETYAIRNVNIIPMTIEHKTIENVTVVIKNKKILSINESIPDIICSLSKVPGIKQTTKPSVSILMCLL